MASACRRSQVRVDDVPGSVAPPEPEAAGLAAREMRVGVGNMQQVIRNNQQMLQAASELANAQAAHTQMIQEMSQAIQGLRMLTQDEARRNGARMPNGLRRRR